MGQTQPLQLPCSTSAVLSRWICTDLDQPSETKLTSAPMCKRSASHWLPFPGRVFSCLKSFKSTGEIFFLLWEVTYTVVHWDLLIFWQRSWMVQHRRSFPVLSLVCAAEWMERGGLWKETESTCHNLLSWFIFKKSLKFSVPSDMVHCLTKKMDN